MDSKIVIPKFDYMCQDNSYSGSVGSFRYKIWGEKKDEIDKVFVAAVYKNNCFEVEDAAGRTEKFEFDYNQEGLDNAHLWILEKLGA